VAAVVRPVPRAAAVPDPRWGRSRLTAGAAGVVVLLGVAGGAYAASTSNAAGYRTALVARRNVTQTLTEVATLAPASSAAAAFPSAGQVASVSVQPGQHVTAGQTLAVLFTQSLAAAVSQDQAAVSTAQATLATAEAAETATPTTTTTTTTTSSSAAAGSGASTRAGGAVPGVLRPLQQAVLGGQHQVDAGLIATRAAATAAERTCRAPASPTGGASTRSSSSPSPSGAPSGARSSSPSSSPSHGSGTDGAGTSSGSACLSAAQRLLTVETSQAAAESALARAESTLDTQLTRTVATTAASTGTTAAAVTGARQTPGATSASTGQSNADPAATLAGDQAGVDAAEAQLQGAQQDLAGATLLSPLTGTVLSVGLTPGQDETPTDQILIEGDASGYQADVSVPVTDLGQLRTGDAANVLPDGSSVALPATVSTIALEPSAGSTSYPVTLVLAPTTRVLRDGAGASVTIVTARAAAALSVPTSALHTVGPVSTVSVLRGRTVSVVRVGVGAKGAIFTVVTSGLSPGERVVLADLGAALPSTTTTTTLRGLTGGFPGRVGARAAAG
jgi:multidrug efflux pump subunit AcrA (membrane-fusion protein)